MFRGDPAPQEAAQSLLSCCVSILRFLFCLEGHDTAFPATRPTSASSQPARYHAPLPFPTSLEGAPGTAGRNSPESGQTERTALLGKGQSSSSPDASNLDAAGREPQTGSARAQRGGTKSGGEGQSLEDLNSQAAVKGLTNFDEDEGDLKKKAKRVASGLSLADIDDEEFCPTCLEPYTDENPAIATKCNHHFHLGCIYEWKERSSACPMCGTEMEWDEL